MKWQIHADCGNSPKNQMLVDWIQNFIERKEELPFITDASEIIYKGKTSALKLFQVPTDILEIAIDISITHGRVGALKGHAISESGNYPFALFFEFSLGKQPKIKSVTCIIDSL